MLVWFSPWWLMYFAVIIYCPRKNSSFDYDSTIASKAFDKA